MNRRLTLASAAVLLAASTASFAQSATMPAPAPPSAWSEAAAQRPAAVAPRPARATGFAADSGQAPAAQAGTGQAPTTTAPQAPRMMRPQRGQLINVKVEFTITDQIGTKPPIKKTMTMVVADGESSRIRSTVEFRYPITHESDKGTPIKTTNSGSAPFWVDVSPAVEGNKVRLDFSVEYSATDFQEDGSMNSKTTVSERLAAILDSGVPLIVAQSSDAYSDRKVTVEIKATILK